MDKRTLSERDICTKFITPALRDAGWDEMSQICEEVSFTRGRIIVRGNYHDNAGAESFFQPLKRECIKRNDHVTREKTKFDVFT